MISAIIQHRYEDLFFHFLLTVPSVCYHLSPGTVSIITKLAGCLYNFSSSVITDKSNKERADGKDGTPSTYLNGPCSRRKIETPFSSKEEMEEASLHFQLIQGHQV